MPNYLVNFIVRKILHNTITLNKNLNTACPDSSGERQTPKPKNAKSEIAVALSRVIFPISKKFNLHNKQSFNIRRYQMYYTGIDLHKFTSYLTTVDSSGRKVKQENLKNAAHNFIQYFSDSWR